MLNLNPENWEFHEPLPSEEVLWRYMDFTKFVSLLEKSALFFARADKLGDPFEGVIPKNNMADLEDEEKSMYEAVSVELRRFMFISCWHESAHESDAMWKIYSSANSGVAIKTTGAAFVESFDVEQMRPERVNDTDYDAEQIHLGKVNYIDYTSGKISSPKDDWLSLYFHKRKSFEHEREVRAIIQYVPDEAKPENLPRLLTHERPPTWPDRYSSPGVNCKVDLNVLIQEIVVDYSADWLLDLVDLVTKRYDLQVPIRRSDLAAVPEWFSSQHR